MIAFLLALQMVSTVGHEVPPIIGMDEQCTTVQPGADWICRNGNWLPPADPVAAAPVPIAEAPFVASFPTVIDPQPGKLYVGTITIGSACDARERTTTWRNDYGRSIYLRKLTLWNGISEYAVVDVQSVVWVSPSDPPMPIWSHNWDRYAPTAFHAPFETVFAPDYVEVIPGGWITFLTKCSPIRAQAPQFQGQQLQIFFVGSVGR